MTLSYLGGGGLVNGDGVDAFAAAAFLTPTLKTGAYTAAHLDWVEANTTSSAFTVTLPASPSIGQMVRISDAARKFGTNALTIDRNGQTIDGAASNFVMNVDGWDVLFYFTGTTWRVIGSGIKRIQRGQWTATGDGSTLSYTVTITAVNPARSRLTLTGVAGSAIGRLPAATLTNGTTITFTVLLASSGQSSAAGWEVVEEW